MNTLESIAMSDYKALLSRYSKANEYFNQLKIKGYTDKQIEGSKAYAEYLNIIENIRSYEVLFEKWKYECNDKFLRLLK